VSLLVFASDATSDKPVYVAHSLALLVLCQKGLPLRHERFAERRDRNRLYRQRTILSHGLPAHSAIEQCNITVQYHRPKTPSRQATASCTPRTPPHPQAMRWRMTLTPAVGRSVPIWCHGGSSVVLHVRRVLPGSDGEETRLGRALVWAEYRAVPRRSDIPPERRASRAVARA